MWIPNTYVHTWDASCLEVPLHAFSCSLVLRYALHWLQVRSSDETLGLGMKKCGLGLASHCGTQDMEACIADSDSKHDFTIESTLLICSTLSSNLLLKHLHTNLLCWHNLMALPGATFNNRAGGYILDYVIDLVEYPDGTSETWNCLLWNDGWTTWFLWNHCVNFVVYFILLYLFQHCSYK